ncbi:hypothetical protein GCM10023189_43150 [Nibrella saemangeumensis]|uniref:DUF1353 domain-containing protein n=1 Tax=Nibrella saemangeumensis TaxID=1084526 RepID=A0ABP8NDP4_9BACT
MPVPLLEASVRKVYNLKYSWWQLEQYATLQVAGREFIIPAGYRSDFASAPRWSWWLVPPHGRSALPSVGHDFLCDYALVPRQLADQWFYAALQEAGVRRWQAWLMFAYVRLLGWARYGQLATQYKNTPNGL